MKIVTIVIALTFLLSGAKEAQKPTKDLPLKHLQVTLDSTNQKLDTLLTLIR